MSRGKKGLVGPGVGVSLGSAGGRQQAAKVESGLLFLVVIHVMGIGLHSCYKQLLNCTKYKQKLSPDIAQQIAPHSPQLPEAEPQRTSMSQQERRER